MTQTQAWNYPIPAPQVPLRSQQGGQGNRQWRTSLSQMLEASDVSFHVIENLPTGTHLSTCTFRKTDWLFVVQICMSVTSIKKPKYFLLSKISSGLSFNKPTGLQTPHMGNNLSGPVDCRTTADYTMKAHLTSSWKCLACNSAHIAALFHKMTCWKLLTFPCSSVIPPVLLLCAKLIKAYQASYLDVNIHVSNNLPAILYGIIKNVHRKCYRAQK